LSAEVKFMTCEGASIFSPDHLELQESDEPMRIGLIALTICLLPNRGALAQQSPASTSTSVSQQQVPAAKEETAEEQEKAQRVLGVLPEFGVTNQKHPRPLTPKEKFHLFYKSAFDPATFAVTGLEAGISQAQDSFPSYGQGASGYGKRYGAAFADQVSSGFFTNYFFPTLLREDPRYFRLGEGTFKRRLRYALVQEFITHKDSGGRTFAWSNALGAVTTGSISNAYYPSEDRGFGLTMSRAGISLLYGSLGGLEDEFWPDIYRKIWHHGKQSSAPDDQTKK
jgi:hypothetical protein